MGGRLSACEVVKSAEKNPDPAAPACLNGAANCPEHLLSHTNADMVCSRDAARVRYRNATSARHRHCQYLALVFFLLFLSVAHTTGRSVCCGRRFTLLGSGTLDGKAVH